MIQDSNTEDLRWVFKSQEGDTEAFDSLVCKYQFAIYNTVYQMVGDADDAKDVTQNAFLKAWLGLSGFNPEYKFFSWLCRIAVNESINRLRSRRPTLDADQLEDLGESPHEQMERHEQDVRMQKAIGRLPAEQRAVVLLRYFEGMSYSEMAFVLELEEGRVKSRLHQAREKLRRILS